MFGIFQALKSRPQDLSPSTAPANVTPLRQSKRKRSQVSYYIPDEDEVPELEVDDGSIGPASDDDHVDDDEMDIDDEYEPRKKAGKKAKKTRQVKKPKLEKPFPFLSLPPELRDMIYEHALGLSSSCLYSRRKSYCRGVCRAPERNRVPVPGTYFTRYLRSGDDGWIDRSSRRKKDQPPTTLALGLLAVNKQIHDEAVGLLYGGRIVVEDTYTLTTFLANIGNSQRKRITHISIRALGEGRGAHKASNYTSMALMQDCTNLRSLVFDCVPSHRDTAKAVARMIWREAHLFMEAYGYAHGKKDAALDIIHVHPKNFRTEMHPQRWQHHNSLSDQGDDDLKLDPKIKEQFDTEMRKLLGC